MENLTVRLQLWLESGESVYCGLGRGLLLSRIREYGSLRKAAESLSMSYRAAWGKLRVTEEALGVALVETTSNRGGYRLTPAGQTLCDQFLRWHEVVERVALEQARMIFSESVQSYADKVAKVRRAS